MPSGLYRVGVLVSGAGTNLQALIDAEGAGTLGASIRLVCSNRASAAAVGRAERAAIPCVLAERQTFPNREQRHEVLAAALRNAHIDLVVLAGFGEVLSSAFVREFAGRIINTHPSLLPAFAGTMHAVRQALEHGVRVTGCTVHLVTDALDAGPILEQVCVEVRADDTVETLHDRIRKQEHVLLPGVVRAYAEGRVRLSEGRAQIVPSGCADPGVRRPESTALVESTTPER